MTINIFWTILFPLWISNTIFVHCHHHHYINNPWKAGTFYQIYWYTAMVERHLHSCSKRRPVHLPGWYNHNWFAESNQCFNIPVHLVCQGLGQRQGPAGYDVKTCYILFLARWSPNACSGTLEKPQQALLKVGVVY